MKNKYWIGLGMKLICVDLLTYLDQTVLCDGFVAYWDKVGIAEVFYPKPKWEWSQLEISPILLQTLVFGF